MHVESICGSLDISAVNQIVIKNLHQVRFVAVIVSCNVDDSRMCQIADIRMTVSADKLLDGIVDQKEHLVFFECENSLLGSAQVETETAGLREQCGVCAQHGEIPRGISNTEKTVVCGKPVFDSGRKRKMKQLAVIAAQHDNILFLAYDGIKPELFEKNGQLGGNLLPGGAPEFKEDDIALAKWYEVQLKKLGVPVTLNSKVTKEQVLSGDYDTVIIATGSKPKVFPLGDDDKVYTAAQVLLKEKDCGAQTVVVGGGLVGCETALWLAQNGKKVTIVEAMDKILALNGPLCSANKEMLELLVPYNGVEVVTGAKVTGYRDGILTADVAGKIREIPCDSVVLSVGYREENSLYQELEFEVPEIYLLGDAKKVANIMYAIWDAFEVANHI